MTNSKPLVISIVGPTAVGKTALAIAVAKHFDTEVVSADSRQFYKEMEIGTAKPTREEQQVVPHHFIDSHSIKELFSAGDFGRSATKKIKALHKSHQVVVVVGGSGLYLQALWEGFDEMPEILPEIRQQLNAELQTAGLNPLLDELKEVDPQYYEVVDRNNGQRVIRALEVIRSSGKPFSAFRNRKKNELPYENLKIGLELEREVLFERINERMDQMINAGLFEEAKSLVRHREHNALKTVGYTEIFNHLDGQYDRSEAVRLLKRNSRRYAKRQMTWFKRYQDIHWFAPGDIEEIIELITTTLSEK